MPKLSDVVQLITECKADLQTLQEQGTQGLQLIRGNLAQKLGQAQAFVNALGEPFTASPADRAAGVQAEINADTASLADETDPFTRMVLARHLANLQLLAASQGMNAALAGVVIFSLDEVAEIKSLLNQAQHDTANRQDLSAGIRILTSIATAAAHIAGTVATSGLV